MTLRVLHLSAQRPGRTGSGVTLEALIRETDRAGIAQAALVGCPVDDLPGEIGPLPADRIHAVTFASAGKPGLLPFPVVGMSDVMPYESSVWSELSEAQLDLYRQAWRAELRAARKTFRPTLVHVHHAWLVAALAREVFSDVPLVVHGHNTGLRQRELTPHLAEEVREGCHRADALCVLHDEQAESYARIFDLPSDKVHVVGAGYRASVFHSGGPTVDREPDTVLFAGKLSRAKGLPWLFDAVERLAQRRPNLLLRVAGGGEGPEADALRARASKNIEFLGFPPTDELVQHMRRAAVFCLPSLSEGLPLVLIEAAACGARLVATDLPGVVRGLAPALGQTLQLVKTPARESVDRPLPEAEPQFVQALESALDASLNDHEAGPAETTSLEAFTWRATHQRVKTVWNSLVPGENSALPE